MRGCAGPGQARHGATRHGAVRSGPWVHRGRCLSDRRSGTDRCPTLAAFLLERETSGFSHGRSTSGIGGGHDGSTRRRQQAVPALRHRCGPASALGLRLRKRGDSLLESTVRLRFGRRRECYTTVPFRPSLKLGPAASEFHAILRDTLGFPSSFAPPHRRFPRAARLVSVRRPDYVHGVAAVAVAEE